MLLGLCRATRDERERPLPGDELVPNPMAVITHAITIAAAPGSVWPWIVQMGSGRAGWYSFDHVDNGGAASARRVIADLQHAGIGDVMPALPGARDMFIIRDLIPSRALVLVVPLQPEGPGQAIDTDIPKPAPRASWALVLETLERDRTRLIARSRVSREWLANTGATPSVSDKPFLIERVYGLLARIPPPLMMALAGAGHYVMESRMLRGIKDRAEGRTTEERRHLRIHIRGMAHQ